jgi:hypothetical protein
MNADDQPDIILGNFDSIVIYYTHCNWLIMFNFNKDT